MYTQHRTDQEQPVVALEPEERVSLLEHVDADHTRRIRFTVRTFIHTGLRAAELSHMKESWLDGPTLDELEMVEWDELEDWPMVRVPGYQPCRCTYCRDQATQIVDYGDDYPDEGEPGYEDEIEEVLQRYWKPKSEKSERAIPVFHEETWRLMREHLGEHGEVQVTSNALWKRVKRAGDELEFEHGITCHALRHTFGTAFAEQEAPVDTIKRLMGHRNAETTETYIDMTGQQVATQAAQYAPEI